MPPIIRLTSESSKCLSWRFIRNVFLQNVIRRRIQFNSRQMAFGLYKARTCSGKESRAQPRVSTFVVSYVYLVIHLNTDLFRPCTRPRLIKHPASFFSEILKTEFPVSRTAGRDDGFRWACHKTIHHKEKGMKRQST